MKQMIKLTFKDKTTKEFSSAHDWEFNNEEDNGHLNIVKHVYDENKEYDDDEDIIIASININEFLMIECY